MKQKQRTFFWLLALVVLAGGALALLTRYNTRQQQAAEAAAEGSIPLCSFALEELERIVCTNPSGTLTLDYKDGGWTLAGDPAYHLDATACNTMATALSALNAKRALTAEAGEDYGFDTPAATVTVTAAGQSSTFVFGAENPVTGDVYLQKDGEAAVYTVSAAKLSCFTSSKEELFGTFQPSGLAASEIETLCYTHAGGETVRLIQVSEPAPQEDAGGDGAEDTEEPAYENVWRLAGDTTVDLDQAQVQTMLSALCSYVSAQDTGANPADYGFDAPALTAEAKTAEQTLTLTYSVAADGCYLMVEGDSSVYTVNLSLVDAFPLTAQALEAAG